jgi:hypothetical protein
MDFSVIQAGKNNEIENDPQLISGFFTALFTFGDQAIESSGSQKEVVNFISFKNLHYYFFRKQQFFYVIEADSINNSLTKEDINGLIFTIANTFKEFIATGKFDIESDEFCQLPEFENEIRECIARLVRKCLFRRAPIPLQT